MEKFLRIIKSMFWGFYVLGLFYLALYKTEITSLLDLPNMFITILTFLGVIFLIARHISLHMKVRQNEYEFNSIVNHTFRTPLTSVLWFAKEMEKDIPQNERITYLQKINNAVSKVLDLVDLIVGIKDINDTKSYDFKATSLRSIIENVMSKYREAINKKNLDFQISSFKDIPLLTMDLKKITFVIETLVENAVLYTPTNGKVLIDAVLGKNKITIFIADSGIGLSWFERGKMFSKFFRTRKSTLMNPDGVGLKLYLSEKIVARHKGKLYAKSKGHDKGATFFIELPFSR